MYLTSSRKRRPFCLGLNVLTHWGRNRLDAILQRVFSNAFSSTEICKFQLKLYWSLFLKGRHWFRYWLGANQATSHYLNRWWPNASLGFDEFNFNDLSKSTKRFHFKTSSPTPSACLKTTILSTRFLVPISHDKRYGFHHNRQINHGYHRQAGQHNRNVIHVVCFAKLVLSNAEW